MSVGDIVQVSFGELAGFATVVEDLGFGFYSILYVGECRMLHADFMEVVNES